MPERVVITTAAITNYTNPWKQSGFSLPLLEIMPWFKQMVPQRVDSAGACRPIPFDILHVRLGQHWG